MTQKRLEKVPASHELDAAAAQKVFDWNNVQKHDE
jgi:hypothetical protein